MAWCIPGQFVDAFKQKLISGEITPDKLTDMTSKERRTYLEGIIGKENAERANVLFEKKLLLKNQQRGIITWAETLAGLRPAAKKDIISKVNRMEEVLNPETQDAFLADLAAQKLGFGVTMEEAGNISTMAKDVFEKNQKADAGEIPHLEAARAKVSFDNYVADLKSSSGAKTFKEYFDPKNSGELAVQGAGVAKTLKASLDNSVIGRQGLKALFTHPDIWAKNSLKSFGDIIKSFGGKEVLNEVQAEIYARENFRNGRYKNEKLDINSGEESIASHAPTHIPILGRAFKASEAAFTAWQYRTRADVFDRLDSSIRRAGGDTQGLGELVNSLTGRGSLNVKGVGNFEGVSKFTNNVLFSPRLLRSNIDALTGHALSRDMSPAVRKQAALNTIKMITGMASVLKIADLFDKDAVEWDPTSANFGKIRVGDTRFDVSGGMASVAVLAARLATWSSKSSTTGIKSKLNTGEFGSLTTEDVVQNFLRNKLSPAASVISDLSRGKTFSGEKVGFSLTDADQNIKTLKLEGVNLLAPLPITNYLELRDNPNSANHLVAILADQLGIGTNTYRAESDWDQNTGAELTQFKDKVGKESFEAANKEFNDEVNEWLLAAFKNEKWEALSEEDKKKVLTREKASIKKKIFKKHRFYPKKKSSNLPKI